MLRYRGGLFALLYAELVFILLWFGIRPDPHTETENPRVGGSIPPLGTISPDIQRVILWVARGLIVSVLLVGAKWLDGYLERFFPSFVSSSSPVSLQVNGELKRVLEQSGETVQLGLTRYSSAAKTYSY
jgi:hypothetical protein